MFLQLYIVFLEINYVKKFFPTLLKRKLFNLQIYNIFKMYLKNNSIFDVLKSSLILILSVYIMEHIDELLVVEIIALEVFDLHLIFEKDALMCHFNGYWLIFSTLY